MKRQLNSICRGYVKSIKSNAIWLGVYLISFSLVLYAFAKFITRDNVYIWYLGIFALAMAFLPVFLKMRATAEAMWDYWSYTMYYSPYEEPQKQHAYGPKKLSKKQRQKLKAKKGKKV